MNAKGRPARYRQVVAETIGYVVRAATAGSTIRVTYTVQPGPDRKIPRALAVTINSPEEAAPPTTETFTISTRTGTPASAAVHAGRVAVSVLPSPVSISAIMPFTMIQPPIN